MAFISEIQGFAFLALFGIAMFAVTWLFARGRGQRTRTGFLVAGRKVSWRLGAPSIAASWIWAPALFVSVQMAYTMGLPGIFWFAFPNVVALAVFAKLAPKIREKLPNGFTLPQWIRYRLGNEKVHKVYLFPFFFYQLMAVTVQLYAGGNIVTLLTGIPLLVVMPILAAIGLSYTLVSGLKASVITDFLQLALIFVGGIIVIPWAIGAAGGLSAVEAGMGGLAGNFNVLDPGVAFSFGIVTSIGLIAGSISDQQYWQRAFAIKKSHLGKAFVVGAILFGVVPIALSVLGFIAANPAVGVTLPEGVDVSMIGVATVVKLLPAWVVMLFVVMLLAGLSSTLDSALSAASSLYAIDLRKNGESEETGIKKAKHAMIGITIAGLAVACGVIYIPGLGLQHLWWIFNTIAACVMVPTVLSLYWDRLSAKGVLYGVVTAFVVGIPIFVYGNILGDPIITVGASLFIIAVSTGFCLLYPRKEPWGEKRTQFRWRLG